ncbi:hypothetical protein Tco_0824109 [Tanacetum coccineum]|uniref:Uncharacterized protein n=1 Tax=Tanacetum coccineum TaxID=301880 RepID=A0ABQ5AJX7_9ASTR
MCGPSTRLFFLRKLKLLNLFPRLVDSISLPYSSSSGKADAEAGIRSDSRRRRIANADGSEVRLAAVYRPPSPTRRFLLSTLLGSISFCVSGSMSWFSLSSGETLHETGTHAVWSENCSIVALGSLRKSTHSVMAIFLYSFEVKGFKVEDEAFDFKALKAEDFDFEAFEPEAFKFEAYEDESFDFEAYEAFTFEATAFEDFDLEALEAVDFEGFKALDLEAFEAIDFKFKAFDFKFEAFNFDNQDSSSSLDESIETPLSTSSSSSLDELVSEKGSSPISILSSSVEIRPSLVLSESLWNHNQDIEGASLSYLGYSQGVSLSSIGCSQGSSFQVLDAYKEHRRHV